MNAVRVLFLWLMLAGYGKHVLLAQATRNPPSDYPIQPVETAPLIAALKTQIRSQKDVALERFWREIEHNGTPVIERTKSDSHHVVVTFLLRGGRETQSVELIAPLENVPRMPRLPLNRLQGTNVWYGSWRMPDDLRFTYRLIPIGSAGNSQQLAVPDPLNLRNMTISFEGGTVPTTELAIASMPNAPPEEWIAKQSTAPEGIVVKNVLNGGARFGQRTIWVYTPPGYDPKSPTSYPLVVLFDGFSFLHWMPTPTILNNLIHARKIPAFIAVLIDDPPNTRSSDLGYNAEFAEYVSK